MRWTLVSLIVLSTMACDYLQASAVKEHGEIAPGELSVFAKLFRQWRLALSIVFMALSFFSFTQLLAVADLSFAVPATALTIPAETFMARSVLRENVGWRRWAGAVLVAIGVFCLEL
ncbi:EamA family transporter [Bryobacter aggregatus]|uniref:EamA family transporter n=1 Tax=Bryobacter aggregatus TaxID=360054 RepID=UPI0004E106AA|nr:EamA family transporter [Bryobacter aggregatus]